MRLHLIDLLISALPVLFPAKALNPLHHNPPVPGSVKNGNMTCLWHMIPETPQIMVLFFDIIGRGCGTHLVSSGIQMAGQTPDCSALSPCIPAFKAENHRNSQPVQLTVKQLQLFLKPVNFFFVGLPGHRFRQVNTRENSVLVPAVFCLIFHRLQRLLCRLLFLFLQPLLLRPFLQSILQSLCHCL